MIKPIDIYVINSLLKENKITPDILLKIINKYTCPTDFCNELIARINNPDQICEVICNHKPELFLTNCGPTKLRCIKVIKDVLKYDLATAKSIVDACPVIIPLAQYNEQTKYILKRELSDIDAQFEITQ